MGIKPKPNRTEEPRTIAKRPHLAENVCQLSSSEFLADFMSPSTPEVSTENEFDAYLLLSNIHLMFYTVSQKTSHLWLAITLMHLNGF